METHVLAEEEADNEEAQDREEAVAPDMRPPYSTFERMHDVVCKSYGECWRRYGLSHIWDEMHAHVRLSSELRSDGSDRKKERETADSRLPFSKWRSVFWQWSRGQITAGEVRARYGEWWLSLFTRVSTFGLEP